jgi:hypothetical protein
MTLSVLPNSKMVINMAPQILQWYRKSDCSVNLLECPSPDSDSPWIDHVLPMIYHGFTVLPGADVTVAYLGQLQAASSVYFCCRSSSAVFAGDLNTFYFDPPLIQSSVSSRGVADRYNALLASLTCISFRLPTQHAKLSTPQYPKMDTVC